jgi:hypothetical protein
LQASEELWVGQQAELHEHRGISGRVCGSAVNTRAVGRRKRGDNREVKASPVAALLHVNFKVGSTRANAVGSRLRPCEVGQGPGMQRVIHWEVERWERLSQRGQPRLALRRCGARERRRALRRQRRLQERR